MRKGVTFAIKRSFRSICNHPFLVGILCLLVFMYRSSPFIFSLLVSASPVFVCTAVLLGTLLSFGQENVPETEIEEKKCHETVFMKRGGEVLKEAVVVDQNGSYYVAKLSEETIRDGGFEEESSKEPRILVVKRIGEICSESNLDETPVISSDERIEENWEETPVVSSDERIGENWEEANSELFEKKTEWNKKGLLSDGEVMESNEYASIPKANDESIELDDEKMGEEEHEEAEEEDDVDDDDDDDDDEALDSGLESESSSPEASMTEVMPMLDELHPLLDEDGPQAVQTSLDGSSSDDEDDDDETENLEVEDDNDNGYNKVEKTKSAITWTEEDQRNLMDLGSSEIERNQRLENLLMRRKARKNMSMGPQMSLIDFDPTSDLAPLFNLPPPITTTRQNPFDDTYDNDPIPGSAPSILLPRRNPFDIPYSTCQEKIAPPPTVEDQGFETSSQSREQPFFTRHESFSMGPSMFAQNRQDVQFRPFFIPEASGDSSYSMFHRIPSEVSESKASSVLTESLGSVEDLEDHKLPQEDNSINNINNNHPQEVSHMEEHEEVIEKCESGDQELVSKDVSQEPELISKIGHGSHSSGEEDDDDHEFDVNLKFQSRDVETLNEEGDLALYSCSSSSSLSEASEMIFTKTDVEKPKIKTQTSIESSTPSITNSTLVDDVHHKEPVYDRSPTSHAEKADLILPPVVVKRTVSFVERKTKIREYEREEGYVLSSDSDADVFHEVNEKLVSTPSAVGGTTTIFYDVMHDHHFELLDEAPVPNTPVESFEKPRTLQNLNIPEVHELDHDMSPNFNSPISPDFISMPSSVVSEEEASSHADVQTTSEQANKIKEIDGLLSELDKGGDFGLTRWESCSNVLEKNLDAKDTVSEMPELEARTVKDIDAVYKKFSNEENELGKNTDKKADANTLSEMPELEARKVKDIDVVYKKLSNNEIVKTDTVSEMPELEARTVKDIDAVYKKLSDKENELEKNKDKKDKVSEMPELEAKTVKDIDEVYKKFSDKETEKPVVDSEGTSSEELLNGKSDKEVKLNMDKGSSVDFKAEKKLDSSVDKESSSSVKETDSVAAEKPEDVHSTTSGTGWFGASRMRFFG